MLNKGVSTSFAFFASRIRGDSPPSYGKVEIGLFKIRACLRNSPEHARNHSEHEREGSEHVRNSPEHVRNHSEHARKSCEHGRKARYPYGQRQSFLRNFRKPSACYRVCFANSRGV
ncbi:hypothetical protein [Treponema endosymbiont of Eucomonympha sp.]|uniref:hypothetical protein n=1 Tax=Treponema endosymbiont of Eucomonympha sp. TaxID=1580831 RepID=UPI00139682C9|nr:hypothetical protein [Treponema endosymbiont of Eucomonympha sp.]